LRKKWETETILLPRQSKFIVLYVNTCMKKRIFICSRSKAVVQVFFFFFLEVVGRKIEIVEKHTVLREI